MQRALGEVFMLRRAWQGVNVILLGRERDCNWYPCCLLWIDEEERQNKYTLTNPNKGGNMGNWPLLCPWPVLSLIYNNGSWWRTKSCVLELSHPEAGSRRRIPERRWFKPSPARATSSDSSNDVGKSPSHAYVSVILASMPQCWRPTASPPRPSCKASSGNSTSSTSWKSYPV